MAASRDLASRGEPALAPLHDVACNLCGASRPRRLFAKHGLTIVRCAECGLAYVSPRPEGFDTLRVYQGENYYHNQNACAFGYGDYETDALLHARLFAIRLAEIETYRLVGRRLLDVGCATGVLLEQALERGWDAQGIDVSAFAVARCRERGLRVHEGDLATARLPAGSFDVVVMDDTIEHLADPRRSLAVVHSLLAPGGLLTINTPNEAGWLRTLMGRHWFHFKPQEHLYYFDAASLGRLLGDTGFEVLATRRSGKIVTLAYLCGRARAYSPLAARVLDATVARLALARRHFLLPIGEFAIFARRV